MLKNKIIAFLFLGLISVNVNANCGTKSYSINIKNGPRYILHLDECGIKPVIITATLLKKSSREEIIKKLINFFSSPGVLKMQKTYFDSSRVISNLEKIDVSKWYRLNKNYEFCSQQNELKYCKEFTRIKFRNGELHFTYNRL
jgi:hypothetical protein